jgi:CRISPR-associated protein Csb2
MVVLELRFPAGRYHATPWGRHVNEGAVEWPPSTWRIVRALVATWYLKAQREISKKVVCSLLGKLCQPPNFQIPQAVAFHTRHYMPLIEGKNEKPTKIFDTFVQLPRQATILVQWNVDLAGDEMEALQILADRLAYFGRAESLVLGRVRDDSPEIQVNASPLPAGDRVPEKYEGIRVLCPMGSAEYEKWREDFLAKTALVSTGKKTGSRKSAKTSSTDAVPADLFEALHIETGSMQREGWNLPPGAKFVTYCRPENALIPPPRQRVFRTEKRPTVARYTVVSTVLPRITRAISLADRIHKALCSTRVTGLGTCPPVFRGTNDDQDPLSGHRHAHIFCEANDVRDVITHITIWAPMGFDKDACNALRSLSRVWGDGGHDVYLVLHGLGQPIDFVDSPLFRSASVWRSFTPFVSTRHGKCFRDGRPKINPSNGWQIGSAPDDLLRLLALNPKTQDGSIQQHEFILINQGTSDERKLRCLEFQTVRHDGGGRRGSSFGASFCIVFPDQVSGPLALGYCSHFGLGLFVPDE